MIEVGGKLNGWSIWKKNTIFSGFEQIGEMGSDEGVGRAGQEARDELGPRADLPRLNAEGSWRTEDGAEQAALEGSDGAQLSCGVIVS